MGLMAMLPGQSQDRPCLAYDHYVQVHSNSSLASEDVQSILVRALGSRARAVNTWTDSARTATCLHIGLLVDGAHASRLVDRGPSPQDESAAAAFRALWGEKTELRRFKDGEILECVAWEEEDLSSLERRSLIPLAIVRYILTHHLGDKKIAFKTWGRDLVDTIALPDELASSLAQEVDISPFQHLHTVFDQLTSSIRTLDDLPLKISAIIPIGPAFTYTSVFAPTPVKAISSSAPGPSSFVAVHDFIIRFESSNQWPDDLIAIQKLKLAFFHRVALSIQQRVRGAHACVKLLDAASAICDQAELQIVTDTGYAFRGRIERSKDQQLLLRRATDPAATARQVAETEGALKEWRMHYNLIPTHTKNLHLLVMRFPALAQAIRLTKRWFANHLLSNHISSQAIELMVASVFVNAGTFDAPPSTGICGFARALHFLATWDWVKKPLIVRLDRVLNEGDAAAGSEETVLNDFRATRASDPGLYHGAFYIATLDDTSGRSWAWDRPSRLAAGRISALAKACMIHWQSTAKASRTGSTSLIPMFQPPLHGYDFIIHLKPVSTRSYQSMHFWQSGPKLLRRRATRANGGQGPEHLASQSTAILDFDPVADFVTELERIYNDSLVLFYDAYGGPVIGGLFNPVLREPRRWKINLDYNTIAASDQEDDRVVLNTRALIAEIERLGRGLIDRIEEQRR